MITCICEGWLVFKRFFMIISKILFKNTHSTLMFIKLVSLLWGAISQEGKLTLLFLDSSVKTNQLYYIKHDLQDNLLQYAQNQNLKIS
jgi:hypothetical protein